MHLFFVHSSSCDKMLQEENTPRALKQPKVELFCVKFEGGRVGFGVVVRCAVTGLIGFVWSNYSDLTPNGGLVREISLFQGNLGW